MKYNKNTTKGSKTPFVMKIIKKKVPFNKEGEREMYCLRPSIQKVKRFEDVARGYVAKCGLNDRVAELAVALIGEGLLGWLQTGYAVNIPNIGTLKPVINSRAHLDPHECSINDVKSIKIQFFPCKEMNKTLESVALRISNHKEMERQWDEVQKRKKK